MQQSLHISTIQTEIGNSKFTVFLTCVFSTMMCIVPTNECNTRIVIVLRLNIMDGLWPLKETYSPRPTKSVHFDFFQSNYLNFD
jgi:hypothetical protein